jgi:hypothetical protein
MACFSSPARQNNRLFVHGKTACVAVLLHCLHCYRTCCCCERWHLKANKWQDCTLSKTNRSSGVPELQGKASIPSDVLQFLCLCC